MIQRFCFRLSAQQAVQEQVIEKAYSCECMMHESMLFWASPPCHQLDRSERSVACNSSLPTSSRSAKLQLGSKASPKSPHVNAMPSLRGRPRRRREQQNGRMK